MSTKKKTVPRLGGYRHLAGGADSESFSDVRDPGGVVGGLAAAQAVAGHRVRPIDPKGLIPHPFNDPKRSDGKEDDEGWHVLLQSVAAQGVRLPALVVTRHAFVAARPALADSLPEGTHVVVYGHRRAEAARIAGLDTIPAAVDDEVMKNDGDLDLMALENIGRQDLDPMAEAQMFARFAETGLSQDKIAERLGLNPSTVSRRMALLLLTEEAVAAVEQGQLPATAAAALAGTLPYGPLRSWQKRGRHDDQNTEERRQDQVAALARILHGNESATRAAERVREERQSRRRAVELGIRVVADPAAELGGPVVEISPDSAHPAAAVGTIDDVTGALLVWGSESAAAVDAEAAAPSTPSVSAPSIAVEDDEDAAERTAPAAPQRKPKKSAAAEDKPSGTPVSAPGGEATSAPESRARDVDEVAAAVEGRLAACATAAQNVPGKNDLVEILAAAIAHGVDTSSERVRAQADVLPPTGDGRAGAGSYGAHAAIAWRRVLAGYEVATAAAGENWGPAQTAYIELLASRVRTFKPTAWERRVMHRA